MQNDILFAAEVVFVVVVLFIFPILLDMTPILGVILVVVAEMFEVALSEVVAVVLVPLDLSPMGFKLPSTCSPAISLDSPGSLTIKIRPLGADANSFSCLASKGNAMAGATDAEPPAAVTIFCVGVPPVW